MKFCWKDLILRNDHVIKFKCEFYLIKKSLVCLFNIQLNLKITKYNLITSAEDPVSK